MNEMAHQISEAIQVILLQIFLESKVWSTSLYIVSSPLCFLSNAFCYLVVLLLYKMHFRLVYSFLFQFAIGDVKENKTNKSELRFYSSEPQKLKVGKWMNFAELEDMKKSLKIRYWSNMFSNWNFSWPSNFDFRKFLMLNTHNFLQTAICLMFKWVLNHSIGFWHENCLPCSHFNISSSESGALYLLFSAQITSTKAYCFFDRHFLSWKLHSINQI